MLFRSDQSLSHTKKVNSFTQDLPTLSYNQLTKHFFVYFSFLLKSKISKI